MGYVGNQTTNAFTSMDKQDITGNGGTSYTLSHAVANAQEIEVFVNNVRQEPAVAYTATGTALTMTGNVESTDDFYVVYQGKAVQTVVPPDGSVTSAKLDTNMAVSGNLAVGTSSAATKLHVAGSGNFAQTFRIEDTSVSGRRLEISYNSTSPYIWVNNSEPLAFYTGDSERMRLDSSGNLLVGTTDTTPARNNDAGGMAFTAGGRLEVSQTSGPSADFNRTNDGQVIKFLVGGTAVGSIGSAGGGSEIYFTGNVSGTAGLYMANSSRVVPMRSGSISDNTVDCGHPSYRFDDIYATNGSIQTSDQNEKQQIASLTTAEITAAKAISQLFKTFKWNDKVEAKGDGARTHTGVIAQEVQTAMSNAGLDAADYAFWCSNTWTDDDGNSQTRMGIRYPELLAFVGAATEQRLANIETRLTALEAN